MIVAPIADVNTPLPYDTEQERVDEERPGTSEKCPNSTRASPVCSV